MARPATSIHLTETERIQLESWLRQPKAQARHVERARIILWAADGLSNQAIADRLDTRPARICKWRVRFDQDIWPGWRTIFVRAACPLMTRPRGNVCWHSWTKPRPKVGPLGPVHC